MNHKRIRIHSHQQSRLPHNLLKDGWWLDDKPTDHEVRLILLPGASVTMPISLRRPRNDH